MQLLLPDHRWVKHLKGEAPPWLAKLREPVLIGKGERIIAAPTGQAVLYRVPVGKGQLIYTVCG